MCAFLDIEGAFDNTSFNAICEAARRFGVNESIIRWIQCMLRHRTVMANLGGTDARAQADRGCPQGGVLSPLLWSLVVDELLAGLKEEGVGVQGYADDIVIYVKGSNLSAMKHRLQGALNLTEEWCSRQSLRVNPTKTELLLFTRKRDTNFGTPSIYGEKLRTSKEVKYLGVILDQKLTWRRHIEKQAQKTITTLWACRRMFNNTWGLKPRMVKWIYTAILKPQLSYASLVWWPALEKAKNRRTLESIYRLVNLGITGAIRTTPTLAMGALLHLEPLHVVIKTEAGKAALRLQYGEGWRNSRWGHASVLSEEPWKELSQWGWDGCNRSLNLSHEYQVIFPRTEDWLENQDSLLNPKGLVWYTDGSKIGAKVGIGVYCQGPKVEYATSLGRHSTVIQAEICAIRACASFNLDRQYRGKHIYICTDSKAALNVLTAEVITSRLTADCRDLLTKLAKENKNKVKLLWVPSHSGIQGNERADDLARLGATEGGRATDQDAGITKRTLKQEAERWGDQLLAKLWRDSKGMRHTKALFKEPSRDLGLYLVKLDRSQLKMAVGLITGHWYTKKHMTRLGISSDAECPRCEEEEETPLHVICGCKGVASLREEILGRPYLEAADCERVGVKKLLQFATKAGLTPTVTN